MISFTVPPALDPAALPSSTSPDLILVPASLPEYEQTWFLNSGEWAGPLTLQQYFDRERCLNKQDLTKNDGITPWILTSPALPRNLDGTRPILAACETILKSGYVARNGELEYVRVHGIGSVFTRSEHRGKGYAGRMMIELDKQLETYQQMNGDKGCFSVLFSDIGQKFYAKFGWKPFASTHIHLLPLDETQFANAKKQFPAVRDITRKDLVQLCTVDWFETALKKISEEDPQTPHVAIRPDMEHFDWHFAREEIQTKLLRLPSPQVKGAIHEKTGIAMIWCRVYTTRPQDWSLHVLHIAMPPALRQNPAQETQDALAALLLRAQYEAHAWDMAEGVEVWDPSELIVSAAQSLRAKEHDKVEVVWRDRYHVCSLKWNGDTTSEKPSSKVNWVGAEKYCWC